MIHRKILKKILSIIFIVSLFANNISGNNFFHKNDNKIKSNNNKNHLLSKFNKRKIWFLAC
ncbi:MAG: hypothetical protein LBJ32_01220, partial [Oscillospiraceae bacterium]|nr:hypothetical protein [Oscillospiraceae bacterium]